LFAVIVAADGLPFVTRACIGDPVTGDSGEVYRPLLGVFSWHGSHMDGLTPDARRKLTRCVRAAEANGIKARYGLLLPAAADNDIRNWGVCVDGGFMPLPVNMLSGARSDP
jgi:hypothetical protein